MKANGEGATDKLAPVKKNGAPAPATMTEYLASVAPRLAQYLPKGMDPDRFMRIVIRALIQNPALGNCTKASLVIAIGEAAELGLTPNGPMGLCALVPYRNTKKNVSEAKCLVMYKGLLELMYRSQKFQVITADEVCENDEFKYEKGMNPVLKHIPALKDRGEPTIYYAYYKTTNGGFDFVVMSREECLEWGKDYSRAFSDKDSPWQTAEAEMCKKTVLRKLAKYSPVAVDIPSEDFEERPEDALKFSSLFTGSIETTESKEGNGGSPGMGSEAKAVEAQAPAGAATPAVQKAPGAPEQEATPGGEGKKARGEGAPAGAAAPDPGNPRTADERAAAAATVSRNLKEGGKLRKGVGELFGVTAAGKLNVQTGEIELSPEEDPDGENGLV